MGLWQCSSILRWQQNDYKRWSIGSWSQCCLSFAKEQSYPYTRNAILESSAFLEGKLFHPNDAHKRAVEIGKLLNCSTHSSTKLFECLKKKPRLEFALKHHFDYPPIVQDNQYFKFDPSELFKKLKANKVNIMIGSNIKEKDERFKK